MRWGDGSEGKKRILVTFEDVKGQSSHEFDRVAECLHWFGQMEAKKNKSHDPVPCR